MSRRSKRQSQADRRRNARRKLRAAKAGDMIAIGYTDGACNVLVLPGDSKGAMSVFRGWWPWPPDPWSPAWLQQPTPLYKKIGPIVSITMTCPGLPLHISMRRIPRIKQTFHVRHREQEAAE